MTATAEPPSQYKSSCSFCELDLFRASFKVKAKCNFLPLRCSWADEGIKWCSFPVQLPFNIWSELCHRRDESDKKTTAALKNIDLWVVDIEEELPHALKALYDSMRVG